MQIGDTTSSLQIVARVQIKEGTWPCSTALLVNSQKKIHLHIKLKRRGGRVQKEKEKAKIKKQKTMLTHKNF